MPYDEAQRSQALCGSISQSPQLLILNYLVPDMFPKGEGKRGERGEHTRYLLHLKNGGRGKSYINVQLFQLP